jgi:hypothetical protein
MHQRKRHHPVEEGGDVGDRKRHRNYAESEERDRDHEKMNRNAPNAKQIAMPRTSPSTGCDGS